jgi:hypothetical protein
VSDVGKPFPPAKRGEYVAVGDTVVALDGPDAMRGVVKRVNLDRAVPQATVKWASGSTGRHTITTLRRVPS